jgi:molybdate transport system substrate-binding protein
MSRWPRRSLAALLLVLWGAACSPAATPPTPPPTAAAPAATAPAATRAPTGEVTVFAAASLTEPFKEIGQAFQAQYPDAHVTFNFAGSNTLRLQLDQGASADVFASADQAQMDAAKNNGDITGSDLDRVFARNRLALITPSANPAAVTGVCDLAKPGLKLVAAQPAVPVGAYTSALLDKASTPDHCGAGFRAKVEANVVSREDDVRQLVSKIQLGEGDAGVCYSTDLTPQVRDAVKQLAIPDDLNTVVAYPIATTRGANLTGGQAFVAFVLSPAGQAILARWGFLTLTLTLTLTQG